MLLSKKLLICEILENSSTEKLTTRCLHLTTSLVLNEQKLSMIGKYLQPLALTKLLTNFNARMQKQKSHKQPHDNKK